MSDAPLAGVRVLDLSRLLPGPYCSLILAQLGAEVVKVEDLGAGDYLRHFLSDEATVNGAFHALNRGKRSLCLDLKKPAGKALLLRLLPRFRVLVESFRPGVMERLGLGYEELRARHPELVLCSISGYGQTGPLRHRAGHDMNYMALSGALGLGGEAGGRPALPGVQAADIAGALWAALRVLAALLGGGGCHLDVSMTEGALAMLLPTLGDFACTGRALRRGEGLLNGATAAYQPYATSDGRHLAVAALEPKFWLSLCQVLGLPGEAADAMAPPARQAELAGELERRLGQRPLEQWLPQLEQADACVEPVLGLEELADHPQHRARGAFVTEEDPELGPVTLPRLPLEGELRGPSPRQGEHTDAVLAEAGLGAAEIEDLRRQGVVR